MEKVIDLFHARKVKQVVDFINEIEAVRKVEEVLYNSLILVTDNDYVIRLDKNLPDEIGISFNIRCCLCCRETVVNALREFTMLRNMVLVFKQCYTSRLDEDGKPVMTLLGEEAIRDYLKELDL